MGLSTKGFLIGPDEWISNQGLLLKHNATPTPLLPANKRVNPTPPNLSSYPAFFLSFFLCSSAHHPPQPSPLSPNCGKLTCPTTVRIILVYLFICSQIISKYRWTEKQLKINYKPCLIVKSYTELIS